MELLTAIILGAFAGWVASMIVGKNSQLGWIGNIVVGIVGAFIAGVISSALTGRDRAELGTFSIEAVLWAIAGAVLLLVVVNAITSNRNKLSK